VTGHEAAIQERRRGAPSGCSLNLSFQKDESVRRDFESLHHSPVERLIREYESGIMRFIEGSILFDRRENHIGGLDPKGMTVRAVLETISSTRFMVVSYPFYLPGFPRSADASSWGKGHGRIPKQPIPAKDITLLTPLNKPEHFGFQEKELDSMLTTKDEIQLVLSHMCRCYLETLFSHLREIEPLPSNLEL